MRQRVLVFIWLSMLGAVIAIDRGEHLRLTLFLRFVPPRLLKFVQVAALMIVATFLLAAIGPALEHTQFELIMVSPALEISYSYRVAAIAVGFILMFIVCVVQLLRSYELREILIIGAMIGALLAVLLVAKPVLDHVGPS